MLLQQAASSDSSAVERATFSLRTAVDRLFEKLAGWAEAAVVGVPNLVVALLIVATAALAARLVRRMVQAVLTRVTARVGHARNVVELLSTIAYVIVLAAGTFVALGILSLDGVVTTALAGAGILGLALGFAFQDIAANFIAGIFMAVRAPFVLGDIVETNGYTGTVRDISLRTTTLDTFSGPRVVIPNAKVFQEPLTNFSWRHLRRVELPVGVGYGEDLARAALVAREAVEAITDRRTDMPVEVFYTGFGDSSIDFEVRFWIEYRRQRDYVSQRSEALTRIKAAFDSAGIVIPFPIRTLDFAPSGGVRLREMLGGAHTEGPRPDGI